MRVLFVTNMWPEKNRPGFGRFVKSQAASLTQLGLDVDVFYVRGYRGKRNYLHGASRTLTWNRRLDYDVVHGHYGHSALLARMQVRKPLVVSYCGDDLLGTPRRDGTLTAKSRIEAALFRQLARVSDATITKSSEMAQLLPRRCRDRNHIIPNGVDTDFFVPFPREKARSALGWDPRDRIVLFAGSPDIERKNYPLAAATVERLAGTRLRVAWDLEPNEIRLMMAAADALLLTSFVEGSPNVVKEAMAMELPVVAVPVGDVPERLADVPGCAICPHDPDSLAAAVETAIAHGRVPEAREAVSELGVERVAQRVIDVYRGLLT